MDIQQKTEPLEMHLYSKLEVGEIDKKIIVKLNSQAPLCGSSDEVYLSSDLFTLFTFGID